MKKSKLVAVLVISAMLFSAMPGSASAEYGFWGLLGGAVVGGAAAFFTGGAAIPFIGVGALAGGTAGAGADIATGNEEDANDAMEILELIKDVFENFGY